MIAAVGGLSAIALSASEPVTYLVFPALIWAAFRFGLQWPWAFASCHALAALQQA